MFKHHDKMARTKTSTRDDTKTLKYVFLEILIVLIKPKARRTYSGTLLEFLCILIYVLFCCRWPFDFCFRKLCSFIRSNVKTKDALSALDKDSLRQ